MVITITAFAATLLWKDAGEIVAPLEGRNGYYDNWNLEAKIELVEALADLGELRDNADAERFLSDSSMSAKEKEALGDQIITSYANGQPDTVTLLSILEKLHGDMSTWSIARFFNVESPNAKIALEQGWLTANDPRIMNFFSEYEAVVSAYEQAVREGKEHPSEEQEQVIQQRKQKMEKTQMLMQLKPLVLPMDFDYDIETDGDYDPEDYGPVFAEMLEEKRKRQRNPEEKNEKSTM